MKTKKGALEINKLFSFILMIFVVVLVILLVIFGFSSIREIILDLIDSFISFLGLG